MRRTIVIALLLLLAVPVVALADAPRAYVSRGECSRMTRQIAHYATVVDRARERNNTKWEENTLQHIGRISDRRARLCPEYRERPAGEQLLKMLRTAARIATKLYTWGLL
ncbi:hypothetical protein KJ059_11295 [Myxococcota bacterium]|nr:hypothetical protein [Myxococcota bacterium]MCZ7618001.1 hypothetical protein [Myxococcota bacterium]